MGHHEGYGGQGGGSGGKGIRNALYVYYLFDDGMEHSESYEGSILMRATFIVLLSGMYTVEVTEGEEVAVEVTLCFVCCLVNDGMDTMVVTEDEVAEAMTG